MLTKKDILDLIDAGDLNDVFVQLNVFFQHKNTQLNALIAEYINPPSGFSQPQFMTRLQVFVNANYLPPKSAVQKEIDYYDLLSDLDFTKQTKNFERIYPNRNIAAFLLHGATDEEGNDLRWLCKKLLYRGRLNSDLIIDLSSVSNGTFDSLLREFYLRFGVTENAASKTKPIVQLRSQLEEVLRDGHFVSVIKGPETLFNSEGELSAFFDNFLRYLDGNIDKERCTHSLIFLFIDSKQGGFPSKNSLNFLPFNEGEENTYLKEAVDASDLRIIDLAPIGIVKESDIENWILDSMQKGKEFYNRIACYSGKEKELLTKAQRPYQVIQQICAELDVTINDTWKI